MKVKQTSQKTLQNRGEEIMEDKYYKSCPEFDRCNELMEKYWEKGDYEKCFEGHMELAKKGYPLAECQVGYFYWKGIGVKIDLEQAVYWTKLSAEHGDWDAQYNLGEFYEKGIGVEQDMKKAMHWYQMAAAQGQDEALARLDLSN